MDEGFPDIPPCFDGQIILGSSLTEGLPTIENFQKGLYVIAVGGNDYTAFAKNYNQSMPSVRTNVTDVVSKINSTITVSPHILFLTTFFQFCLGSTFTSAHHMQYLA